MIKTKFRSLLSQFEFYQNRRITYKEVADATGITQKTIANWAKGKVTQINTEVLASLCKYFECQPGDLITFEPVNDGETK